MRRRKAEDAAGAMKPRPRVRFLFGIAVSVLLHALLVVLLAWQARPAPEAPRAQRMSVRLLSRPAAVVVVAAPSPSPSPAVVARAPVRKATQPAPAKVEPAAAPRPAEPVVAAAAAPAPVAGIAFGPPRFGLPGTAPASRWTTPRAPHETMPPPGPAPQAQAMAMRDSGRAQVMAAMQQHVAQWQAPSADGACALDSQAQQLIECDSEALQQIAETHRTTLAGMFDAYRGLDPSAARLAIVYSQGRYQLALAAPAQRTRASVTSMPRDVTVTAPGL